MGYVARAGFWGVAVVVIVGAIVVVAALMLERRGLYVPDVERALTVPDDPVALPVERVEIPSSDGAVLVGWVIPGKHLPPGDSAAWLFICKGNTGNIADPARLRHYAGLRQLGLNILAFDYRGFGESTGKPTEDGLYHDADAAYRYLRETRGVPASRIIIYGHSLGSAVAIDVAARVPAAGLIVEGAFTSVGDRARELYAWVPVRWLPISKYASIEKIGRVGMPKLFIHATADAKIPVTHGRRLYAEASDPKLFVEVGGGHSDAFEVDSAKYFETIARFTSNVTKPAHLIGY